MSKNKRLDFIKKIIQEREISTQEELTEVLNDNGFNVSQATVSRDINTLNLIKGEGLERKYKYVLLNITDETPKKIVDLFKHVTISINSANNLIVVKTMSGNAGAAGMCIDQMKIPSIVGTIAGDDTLLIVAKTNGDAESIVKSLKSLSC